ncbi:hypothetical protein BVRB_8g201790 [Beta vulgaris subsp. vulgaris]|uniref:Ubiquitin-like domain-containing protein n=1 Tax=Beta vulgaris subsp. vulgaris TaxID=3555 RepID=A0A0J8B9B8_BETVV|nr:hypothetical protein BVRB_8g201790 [Beta vulgaris subsp. vulgaris]
MKPFHRRPSAFPRSLRPSLPVVLPPSLAQSRRLTEIPTRLRSLRPLPNPAINGTIESQGFDLAQSVPESSTSKRLLVENVKALLEVESGVSLQQQQLLCNGKEIKNHEKLNGLIVCDGDLIMMVSNNAAALGNRLCNV